MSYKPYTSKLLEATNSHLLDDIELKIDERSVITGVVLKEVGGNEIDIAKNALVSLYKGTSILNCYPIYHTYTDNRGRFVFPVIDINLTYILKATQYKTDEEVYKPFTSEPFRVEKGSVHKIVCFLEKENLIVLSGKLINLFNQPIENKAVKLHLTIGKNKIPIVEMAKTITDSAGHFNFSISPSGNYCIDIYI